MKKLFSIAAVVVVGGVTAFGLNLSSNDPTEGQLAFEQIKKLHGTWIAKGDETKTPQTTFHVTAGGSAVLEKIFVGTEKEMLTVYYVEDGQLRLTHYCVLGNQPEMTAKVDGKKIVFDFCCGSNINVEETMHMNNAVYEFVSKDHFKTTWNLHNEGKHMEGHSFEFVRLEPSGAE